MSFIRIKAMFMIVLITFISLTFYIPQIKAQQQECCERTRDGSFCVYTDSSNCNPSSLSAPAFCEDTSFCTLGCCFDSESGECFSNSGKSECDSLGGTWDPSQACQEVPQCSVGCCQLNNQGFLSTLTKCKQVASQFSDTEPNFDASIQDEFSCVNSVRSQEQGCCVSQDSCSFTTRTECSQEERNPIGEAPLEEVTINKILENGKAIGFHPGTLCSLDSLGCNAVKQHDLGCYNEDVYWFDSEGNPENVFLGNSGPQKRLAYNDGRILDEPNCEATPNDPDCGNCDYTKGTLCSEASGKPTCISLDCSDTKTFSNSPDSASDKELGESWCIFDGPVGFAQDRPGSRHFRGACVNGEQIIEPCTDFREEFCTQSVSGGRDTNQYGSIYQLLTNNLPAIQRSSPISDVFQGAEYSEAACRENRALSCSQCNEFSTPDEAIECCNEKAYRDCYFLEGGVSNIGGTCVPNVPLGSRFWSDSQSVLDRQTTKTVDGQDETIIDNAPLVPADEVCSEANTECEVGFSRTTFSDWSCTYNCHCLKEEAFIAAHSVCRSIGDCGGNYNFAEKITRKGFDIKIFGPGGNEAEIPSEFQGSLKNFKAKIQAGTLDNVLIQEPKTSGGPKSKTFSDFFSDSAIPLTLIGATGVISALTAGQIGSFVGGLFLGPSYLFGGASGLFNGAGSTANALSKAGFGETFVNIPPPIEKGANLAGQALKSPIKANFAPATKLGSGTTLTADSTIGVNLNPTGTYTITRATGAVETLKGAQLQGNALAQSLAPGDTLLIEGTGGVKLATPGTGQISGTIGKDVAGVTAAETTVTSTTGLGHVLGVINVISWIWTIYNLIDYFGSETMVGKVEFVCKAWEPPSGGSDCDLCNDPDLPCSEYRCRSLGKACSLINEGSDNELCVNSLPDDSNAPRIAADKEKMKFNIQDEPNRGFTVTKKIPPFTAVKLAIQTDEPAQCKFSTEPSKFGDKEFDFGSQLLDFHHEMNFALPSELTNDQALQLTNGGKYSLYLACEDANGNSNSGDYIINFQIQPGPDVEAPRIQSTSILTGTSIQSGVEAVSTDLFISEPASCKWSNRDVEFNLMENFFQCTSSALNLETTISSSYRCSSPLPIELTDSESVTNTFYFRCKDPDNNANQDSFRYTLTSTPELKITETSPTGVLTSGANIQLEVHTTAGANNGVAVCAISDQDLTFLNMPSFQNTNSNTHTQTIQLLEQGTHIFFVTCLDKAGNEAKSNIEFLVEADSTAPILFSIFKDSQLGILSITTNEPTTCEYSDQQFTLGSGIPMTNENSITHEASLGNFMYIIKCEDEFNNPASFTVFP